MPESGSVTVKTNNGIGAISFFHPKKNSLPGDLLQNLATEMNNLARNNSVKVVVLRSEGDGPFCAGASFDELLAVDSFERGREFFMGFARLILAMKNCPKFVITRVQGKTVGGGVGVVAASDYALATENASIKLSELALGIGPFIIGPAVERKVGLGAYAAMSIDSDWRDARWAKQHGLYTDIHATTEELDNAVDTLADKLATFNPEAMAKLKSVFWEGTDHWDELLPARAEMSGRLVLSESTAKAISAFKAE
jgi:methylglutaconyl-CoA hydratase